MNNWTKATFQRVVGNPPTLDSLNLHWSMPQTKNSLLACVFIFIYDVAFRGTIQPMTFRIFVMVKASSVWTGEPNRELS